MSSSPALPSLFGRFTAIYQDHDHLAKTLRALRSMCSALEEGSELPPELTPGRLIVDLRADLATHFAAEESEQYFGTVEVEAPQLASQIATLESEHRLMLLTADMLCEVSREPTRWPELPSPTRQLVRQLERHERSESALLRALFS